MKITSKLAIVSVALASLATAAPAFASDFVFSFAGGKSGVNGPDGVPLTKTVTVGGQSVTVSITAWAISGGKIADAYLGDYSTGLGVTSDNETGGNNTHVIDNQGDKDFLLLKFSTPVTLKGINTTVFNVGGSTDSDAEIGYGNTSSAIALNGKNVSALNSLIPTQFVSTGNGTSGSRTISSGTGNIWLIGAAFTNVDGKIDGFKLTNITVTPSVPEPSTWAMMLIGFGVIGGATRYRRRKVEASFAAA